MIKLQDKINLRYLIILLAVFSIAGMVLYLVLGSLVDRNIDEILRGRVGKIKHTLQRSPEKILIPESLDESMFIRPGSAHLQKIEFSDTILSDPRAREPRVYRMARFNEIINDKPYEVIVLMSRIESEDMIELITWYMLGLFAVVTIVLFVLNRWLSARIWKPFYLTLSKLKNYRIGKPDRIIFESTDIREFDQMNLVITGMIHKLDADYTNLKNFTENAAHEMQTPLAIIKSKLELALQDKGLSTERYNEIGKVYETANKLSRLNESLLLLSKIENQQFVESINIDLCQLINQQLSFIDELIKLKNLKVQSELSQPFNVNINPYLAEILINNLLSNALKHNLEGGRIIITSTVKQIVFSNTGKPLTISPEKLFQRFVKQNTGSESTGLGLSIASGICENYKMVLEYTYQNGYHNILLNKLNPV